MGDILAEILRIASVPLGAVVAGATGPAGAVTGPVAAGALKALANQIDKEDSLPEQTRKMKQKRREGWIKFSLRLEKDKEKRLEKYPVAARPAIRAELSKQDAADLRSVIRGDIFETENREATDQEVNLLAEAVSARVREKL